MEFKNLQIIEPILKAIEFAGHTKPTPIQIEAIPSILDNKDLLASAQTGTGKTAAFAIPILQQIYNKNIIKPSKAIKALVLTPTRELATQVGEDFYRYSKYLKIRSLVIFGGVPQVKQTQALNRGTTVLIATPGRLMDLMNQGYIKLNEIEYFVLDEADQMLDMGFIHDVRKIVKAIPNNRQSLLFSATMPDSIIKLARELLKDPIRIEVTPTHQTLDIIKQKVYHVNKREKTDLLIKLIKENKIESLLVFTRTKHLANRLVTALGDKGFKSEAIHGNKSQSARERALDNFKKGKTKILVATDIAARGIDIDGLSYVINYDLPETPETYLHRIGRTGRAGSSGVAISFCEEDNLKMLQEIERHIKTKIEEDSLYQYIASDKILEKNNKSNNNRNLKFNNRNNSNMKKRTNKNTQRRNNTKNKKI
ncbi:MAG TPA: DEAD/DEAH box helicase [Acholeplasmataceae bacterium]|nr:DEAD/DEAH box helicase [Acholeplasmataceae bacterium]